MGRARDGRSTACSRLHASRARTRTTRDLQRSDTSSYRPVASYKTTRVTQGEARVGSRGPRPRPGGALAGRWKRWTRAARGRHGLKGCVRGEWRRRPHGHEQSFSIVNSVRGISRTRGVAAARSEAHLWGGCRKACHSLLGIHYSCSLIHKQLVSNPSDLGECGYVH